MPCVRTCAPTLYFFSTMNCNCMQPWLPTYIHTHSLPLHAFSEVLVHHGAAEMYASQVMHTFANDRDGPDTAS